MPALHLRRIRPSRAAGGITAALLLATLVPPPVSVSLPGVAGAALAGPSPAVAQAAEGRQGTPEYVKREVMIPMRDGIRLHTTIYTPVGAAEDLPFIMQRTPYSCRPYGSDGIGIGFASRAIQADGYIFVCQDVRGRWMSEGVYDNMRPHVPGDGPDGTAVDESSDTWDTIDWLLANVEGHNGKVGMKGISYPGFYAAAALPEAHPALAASSPQAPIADFYFDDFHHRGAFTQAYFLITGLFAYEKTEPTSQAWYDMYRPPTPDGYRWHLHELGPLSNADRFYGEDAVFWQQIVEHPDYDAFWQSRSILPHLTGIDHAVLTVGGFFDAEDLYGPLNIYRTVEQENPGTFNAIVMGPWSHGDWGRTRGAQVVGDIWFGDGLSESFQEEVEAPFFRHFLKGEGEAPTFEALMYDTGRREWTAFDRWPPADAQRMRMYLRDREVLSPDAPAPGEAEFTEYLSDPNEPVPYTDRTRIVFTPRAYMSEDQRFAESRPDVIEFMTEPLEEAVTFAGDLTAHLQVSVTGTDADFAVKLIDVYPDDTPNNDHTPDGIYLAGYQQMVRSEIQRGRYRNSFERPEPFEPGEVTLVEFPLQDVYHTFEPGHRIMIQVQSTWFPLFDRNPQTFVPNIYKAVEGDFVRAFHRGWHTAGRESWVEGWVR
jgi:putative CocE/NonD family hydrolase